MRYYRIPVFFQRRADAFVSELRLAFRTRQSHEQLRLWLQPCGDPRHRNLRRPIGQIMCVQLSALAQVWRALSGNPFHVTGLPPAYADGRIKGRNERPLAVVAFQWIMKHFPKVRGSPHNVRQPRFPWSLSTFRNMRAACLRPQAC